MIKSVIFPNYEFETKESLFKSLFDNKEKIISIKKARIHKGCEKGQFSHINLDMEKVDAEKNIGFEAKTGFIYPVISTTRFFDSHKDVHFDGSMTKTSEEQQGKVFYALDHNLNYDNILTWQENVKMFIANIPWGLVGKEYEGTTQGLIFEIDKKNIRREDVLKDIEERSSMFQNSIRMIYHKISVGIKSDKKEHKKEREYYESRIELIANKDEVEKEGYFFGVEELGISREGSLVPSGGSNTATTIYEAVGNTSSKQEDEPPINGTQTKKQNIFIKI